MDGRPPSDEKPPEQVLKSMEEVEKLGLKEKEKTSSKKRFSSLRKLLTPQSRKIFNVSTLNAGSESLKTPTTPTDGKYSFNSELDDILCGGASKVGKRSGEDNKHGSSTCDTHEIGAKSGDTWRIGANSTDFNRSSIITNSSLRSESASADFLKHGGASTATGRKGKKERGGSMSWQLPSDRLPELPPLPDVPRDNNTIEDGFNQPFEPVTMGAGHIQVGHPTKHSNGSSSKLQSSFPTADGAFCEVNNVNRKTSANIMPPSLNPHKEHGSISHTVSSYVSQDSNEAPKGSPSSAGGHPPAPEAKINSLSGSFSSHRPSKGGKFRVGHGAPTSSPWLHSSCSGFRPSDIPDIVILASSACAVSIQWVNYLKRVLVIQDSDITISYLSVEDITKGIYPFSTVARLPLEKVYHATLQILVISPSFLEWIESNICNLDQLLHPTRVLGLLLGTSASDLSNKYFSHVDDMHLMAVNPDEDQKEEDDFPGDGGDSRDVDPGNRPTKATDELNVFKMDEQEQVETSRKEVDHCQAKDDVVFPIATTVQDLLQRNKAKASVIVKEDDHQPCSFKIFPRKLSSTQNKLAIILNEKLTSSEVLSRLSHGRSHERDQQVKPEVLISYGDKVIVIEDYKVIKDDILQIEAPDIILSTSQIAILQLRVNGVNCGTTKLKLESNFSLIASIWKMQTDPLKLFSDLYGKCFSSMDQIDMHLAELVRRRTGTHHIGRDELPPWVNSQQDDRQEKRDTMLHWAANHGMTRLAEALLQAGGIGQTSILNGSDFRPADLAEWAGHRNLAGKLRSQTEDHEYQYPNLEPEGGTRSITATVVRSTAAPRADQSTGEAVGTDGYLIPKEQERPSGENQNIKDVSSLQTVLGGSTSMEPPARFGVNNGGHDFPAVQAPNLTDGEAQREAINFTNFVYDVPRPVKSCYEIPPSPLPFTPGVPRPARAWSNSVSVVTSSVVPKESSTANSSMAYIPMAPRNIKPSISVGKDETQVGTEDKKLELKPEDDASQIPKSSSFSGQLSSPRGCNDDILSLPYLRHESRRELIENYCSSEGPSWLNSRSSSNRATHHDAIAPHGGKTRSSSLPTTFNRSTSRRSGENFAHARSLEQYGELSIVTNDFAVGELEKVPAIQRDASLNYEDSMSALDSDKPVNLETSAPPDIIKTTHPEVKHRSKPDFVDHLSPNSFYSSLSRYERTGSSLRTRSPHNALIHPSGIVTFPDIDHESDEDKKSSASCEDDKSLGIDTGRFQRILNRLSPVRLSPMAIRSSLRSRKRSGDSRSSNDSRCTPPISSWSDSHQRPLKPTCSQQEVPPKLTKARTLPLSLGTSDNVFDLSRSSGGRSRSSKSEGADSASFKRESVGRYSLSPEPVEQTGDDKVIPRLNRAGSLPENGHRGGFWVADAGAVRPPNTPSSRPGDSVCPDAGAVRFAVIKPTFPLRNRNLTGGESHRIPIRVPTPELAHPLEIKSLEQSKQVDNNRSSHSSFNKSSSSSSASQPVTFLPASQIVKAALTSDAAQMYNFQDGCEEAKKPSRQVQLGSEAEMASEVAGYPEHQLKDGKVNACFDVADENESSSPYMVWCPRVRASCELPQSNPGSVATSSSPTLSQQTKESTTSGGQVSTTVRLFDQQTSNSACSRPTTAPEITSDGQEQVNIVTPKTRAFVKSGSPHYVNVKHIPIIRADAKAANLL